MRASVAAAFLLLGCDQLLGLTQVRAKPDAPAANVVTGRVVQHLVSNNSSFQPVVTDDVIPRDQISLTATLDDGMPAQVAYEEDGTFSFGLESPGQAYELDDTVYGATGKLQVSLPQLVLSNRGAGRLDARANGRSFLTFDFPAGGTATSSAWVVSTGQYSQTDTGLFGPLVNFNWQAVQGAGVVPVGLLDASAHDYVYALEYTPNAVVSSTPYTMIAAASGQSITQQLDGSLMLAAPTTVPPNACIHFATLGDSEYARVNAALPGSFPAYQDWILYWMPAPDVVAGAGAIDIASGGYKNANDLDLAPPVYVPMSGGQLVISSFVGEGVAVTAPGSSPLVVYSGNRRDAKITAGAAAGCTGDAVVGLAGTVGIPGIPALDGHVLDTPDQTIAITGSRVDVTWPIAGAGPVHDANVLVYEVIAASGGVTTISPVGASIIVVGTSAHFDASLFQSQHRYLVLVATHLSEPNAVDGDFDTMAFPIESADTWSQQFVVQ
ncbi:MAG TPA: hypothetical protein VGF94_04890 [Kofleriaceae bacterium]